MMNTNLFAQFNAEGLPVEEYIPDFPQQNGTYIPGVRAAGMWFTDSFENKSFNQWNDQGGGYSTSIDSIDSPHGYYHLKMSGGNHLHQNGRAHIFQPDQPIYVSFYVKYNGPAPNIGGYFLLGPAGVSALNTMIFFLFFDDGTMRIYGNPATNFISVPYTAGQWYHVEFRNIDYVQQQLNWYVDDVLIAAGWPFRTTVQISNVAEAHLYNWDNTVAEYDQIIISGYPDMIPANQDQFGINVFPNPVSDELVVNTLKISSAVLTITDITGRKIFKTVTSGNIQQIDVSSFKEGVYILNLQNPEIGLNTSRQIIVNRQ